MLDEGNQWPTLLRKRAIVNHREKYRNLRKPFCTANDEGDRWPTLLRTRAIFNHREKYRNLRKPFCTANECTCEGDARTQEQTSEARGASD